MRRKDLTGQRFGMLVAQHPARTSGNRSGWLCICDCGKTSIVSTDSLLRGTTKSCGCQRYKGLQTRVYKPTGPTIPMIGRRFGRLTVIEQAEHKSGEQYRYVCKCDCGNLVTVPGYSLRSGNTTSCGCYAREVRREIGLSSKGRKSSKAADLKGQRFEYLFVLERAGSNKSGQALWKCLCNCGNITYVTTSKLKSGATVSCGCLGLKRATEAKITHGNTNTSIYHVFHGMHNRCEKPQEPAYRWYGAKGVKVCDEWTTFEPFYAWAISNGYQEGLTIDRIDPDGDYCPENCRWITRSENSRRARHKK